MNRRTCQAQDQAHIAHIDTPDSNTKGNSGRKTNSHKTAGSPWRAVVLGVAFCLLALFCSRFGGSFATFLLPSSSAEKFNSPARNMQPSISEFLAGQSASRFGTQLFANLCRQGTGNVVMSPVSLSVALCMAASGTSLGGEAHQQLAQLLQLPDVSSAAQKEEVETQIHEKLKELVHSLDSDDPLVKMLIANSIWTDPDVKQSYISTCQETYSAKHFPRKSAAEINKWVEDKTMGMIKNILSDEPHGPAVLLNAVYFKGVWKVKFDPIRTQDSNFVRFNGEQVPCKMMQLGQKRLRYGETSHTQYVLLPYGETDRYTSIIMLPKKEGVQGMKETIDEITAPNFFSDASVVNAQVKPVIVELPRFKIEYGIKPMKDALMTMDVKAPFVPGGHFKRMTDDESVHIMDVYHKAVIEVNEEGTEAAAATAVAMTRSLVMPVDLKFNRPFLFIVMDIKNKLLLFCAKVEEI